MRWLFRRAPSMDSGPAVVHRAARAVLPEAGRKPLGRIVRRASVTGGFVAVLLALYAPVVVGGKTFVLRDALRFTLPSREFLGKSLSLGRLPEWWDGVGFGVAFAANPVHGVTSPLFWLLAIPDSSWAVDALTLLQLLLLALGTFAVARKLGATLLGAFFSGLALVTSGYVVSAVPNGNVPYLTWIPWLVWAALLYSDAGLQRHGPERSWAGLAVAGGLALQLLSGEPGHTLIAGLLVLVVLSASERPFRRMRILLPPMGAGVGLAAVGVLPAFLLLGQSARAGAASGGTLKWSMHPGQLLEWIWPLPFGSEGNESWFIGSALGLPPGDPSFSLSLYVGLPVLILALAATRDRRIGRLLIASSGFLLLALGSYTPAYGIFRMIFPPLRFTNFPEKFFFGVLFLWCVGAGVGFSRIFESERPGRWSFWFAICGSALLALGGIAVHRNRARLESWLDSRTAGVNIREGMNLCVAAAGVAALGAGAFAVALLLRRRGAATPAVVLALLGILAPLVFSARGVTPVASRATVDRPPRILTGLPRSPLAQNDVRPRLFIYPGPRIRPALKTGTEIASNIHETLDTNVAARFGYDVIPGFETGDSARSRRFWEGMISPGMSFLAFVRLLGVDFAMLPDPQRFAPGFPVFARLPGWGIVGTFPVRPRAFVAPRATPVASADEGLRSLTWPGREEDPARVVVSGAGAEALDVRGPLEPCLVRSPRPEEVFLECRSPNGGYAVLLDENLPGWSAELDARAAPILSADGLFRAVRVASGQHRIAFRYRTPGLRLGAVVSALALVVILLATAPWRATRPA